MLIVALVLGNMSFPNITIMSTVVMSKYIGDAGMYDFAISSPLLVSALRQPYLFYTYMAAEGLMIILACVTVYKYIVDKTIFAQLTDALNMPVYMREIIK